MILITCNDVDSILLTAGTFKECLRLSNMLDTLCEKSYNFVQHLETCTKVSKLERVHPFAKHLHDIQALNPEVFICRVQEWYHFNKAS